jgi:hypothetical protein
VQLRSHRRAVVELVDQANRRPDQHQRPEPDGADAHELEGGHAGGEAPIVVHRQDEAAQQEEQIDRQKEVGRRAGPHHLVEMSDDHSDGGDAAHGVEGRVPALPSSLLVQPAHPVPAAPILGERLLPVKPKRRTSTSEKTRRRALSAWTG